MVGWDGNGVLDDPPDDGPAAWLCDLAGVIRRVLNKPHTPPRQGKWGALLGLLLETVLMELQVTMRLQWGQLPEPLRRVMHARLGTEVVQATSQTGGFSPGLASRVRLADGGRVFVKAVSPAQNPDSPELYRAEAAIAAALPASAPAPRLLDWFDHDGWVVLIFEDIDGWTPAQPWQVQELDRVLGAYADLARTLTPAPIRVPTAVDRFDADLHGWRRLHADHLNGRDDLAWLDPWARTRIGWLAQTEAGWAHAAAGDTLTHGDLRADNILLTGDRVYFVDWPWASQAADWFDLVGMLPSVLLGGSHDLVDAILHHDVVRRADPADVRSVLVALGGYFLWQGHQPPPPGMPTVRSFQTAQGAATLQILTRLAG